MRISLLVLPLVATLAVAPTALAKGPDYALLSGPGVSGSIRIDGDGEEGGTRTPLGALVFQGGYASQVFGHHPQEPTTRTRPAGSLGPRYRIMYSVPTPTARRSIVADVYPYAIPHAITFMKPGQAFFGAMRTHGGWYVAKPGLRLTLLTAGLPGRSVSGGTTHWWRWAGITSVVVAALVAGVIVLLFRRRPQSAPAPAS
jgi:hypothetical protein